jgi:hypothetical protein
VTIGDPRSIKDLKGILDDFATAIDLKINFHKSTFVRMYVPLEDVVIMQHTLGCIRSTFPQTCIGLPLSHHKLRVSDYQPLLDNFDEYQAGSKAKLLISCGSLILIMLCSGDLPSTSCPWMLDVALSS